MYLGIYFGNLPSPLPSQGLAASMPARSVADGSRTCKDVDSTSMETATASILASLCSTPAATTVTAAATITATCNQADSVNQQLQPQPLQQAVSGGGVRSEILARLSGHEGALIKVWV